MHVGQQLKYAGGVVIKSIMQPYHLDGTMAEPIVELDQNGKLWGYLTFAAVAMIERDEQPQQRKRASGKKLQPGHPCHHGTHCGKKGVNCGPA